MVRSSETLGNAQGDGVAFGAVARALLFVEVQPDRRQARFDVAHRWSHSQHPGAIATRQARGVVIGELTVVVPADTGGPGAEVLAHGELMPVLHAVLVVSGRVARVDVHLEAR